jgi:hypothetical protein
MKNADGKWVGYGIGDVGEIVKKIQHRLIFAYPKNSHAFDHGVTESGAFDEATRAALIDITTHINHSQGKALRTDGVADFAVQVAIGSYVPPPAAPSKRFIQQGVGFSTDAFLMGNQSHSYVDALNEGSAEWLRLALPDPRPKVIIGYSMGEDVANHGLLQWPADRRDEIKLYVGFGSPSRPPGLTLLGNDPGGQGIAGLFTVDWLRDRAYHFTHDGDMYANAVGLLPSLYQILIRLEASADFAMYLFNLFATQIGAQLLGRAASPSAGAGSLAGLLGLITPGPVAVTNGPIDLFHMITNISAIIQTIAAALQFVQTNAHFRYHDTPEPFWRGMTAVDCAAQIITEKVADAVVYNVPGTVSWWNDGPPAWTAWKLP